jgi:LPXTG-site transpeptidase (sortase) family protein
MFIVLGGAGGLAAIYFFSPDWSSTTPATPTSIASVPTPESSATPFIASTPVERPDIPLGTRLFIPSTGVAASIVQVYLDGVSWDVSKLGNNVGHLKGTAWLPTKGNVVLLGHVELSDGGKGIFASLKDLHMDDVIIVETEEGQFRYQISDIYLTDPSDLKPLYPQNKSMLTLITCDDYDFITDVYRQRLIVVAEQVA